MKRIIMSVYNSIENDARVIRAAEALSSSGYDLTVISCNSDSQYKNPRFNSIVYKSSQNGWKCLIGFWFYVLKFCLIHRKKYDLFYAHDYLMPFIGLVNKKISGKDWIYDAHELLLNRKNYKNCLRQKFFIFLERISIKNASLVVAANPERARIIKNIYKLKNIISVANISSVKSSKEIRKENIIVYQGVLIPERKVENVIEAVSLLPENINLKLIGGGTIEKYRQLAKTQKIEHRTIFTGKLPYSRLLEESKECKVGFVSYRMDELNNYYCSPNKVFEYAQLRIPMIVTPQPFLVEIINKYHIGEVWDEKKESVKDLAHKLHRIIDNYEEYCKGLEEFNNNYNEKTELKKLQKAVFKLFIR